MWGACRMLVQCRPGLTHEIKRERVIEKERNNSLRAGFSTSCSDVTHLPQCRRMPFCGSVTAASEDPMHFSAKPFELTKTKWGIFRTLLPDYSGNGGITADHIKRGGDPLLLSWAASLNAVLTDLSNYEIFMKIGNFQFFKTKITRKIDALALLFW